MTSFRISKGIEKDLPTTKTDGRMYFCTDTGNIYIDYKDGSTVSRKLINKDSLDKKLNLTGGTISGKLTFSGTSADTANLAFSREGYNYITFPANGNLAFGTEAVGNGIVIGISSSGMYPYSNNTKTLGTSDKKWSNVYATNFTGSGASLTSLNASNISSGTLSSDRLPTIPIAKGGTGATTAAGALTNLGITATAAELNKLDGVTATTAELNKLDGVTATTAELNYVDGVTSNIQTQLDAKQAAITGAATSIVSSNLTASRALMSDSSGKVAVSAVTSTELGYLDGVTSNIQTQLDGKAASSHNQSASTITSGTLSSDRLPTVPATKGGTGKTTLKDSATALLASLGAGDRVPTDSTEIITQGIGEYSNQYYRRPMSYIWEYIKDKADSEYSKSEHTHNYAGSSSAGGAAISAEKVENSDILYITAGSTIYMDRGSQTSFIFQKGGSEHARFDTSGNFIPKTNNTYNIGSSSQGWKNIYATTFTGALSGNASTATALTSKSIGSATQPVYFDANGKPVATTYTLGASVPSDAKFTDTNTKVTQSRSTSSSYRSLLLHNSAGNYGTNPGEVTNTTYYNETIAACPSTGDVRATTFTGALKGNADTATKATQDGSGNTITSTYATKTELNTLDTAYDAHKHTVYHMPAGTVSKPTFTGSAVDSGTPSGTTSVYSITGVGSAPSLTATVSNKCLTLSWSAGSVPTRSSVTVASSEHKHSVTASGSVSQPTFTGTAATLTSSTPV